MVNPGFGIRSAEELNPVKTLMRAMHYSSNKTTLDSFESQALLLELYDKEFGIADHSKSNNPLSLVCMHPKELYNPYSREERLTRRYRALRIYEKFGLSIDAFFDAPRDRVEMLLRLAEEENQKTDSSTQDAMAALSGGKH